MGHSNEPWNRGIGNEAHYVYGTKGELIADTFKGLTNGSRIVAAVNHAEDYTNEQLKAVSMKEMWGVIELCAYAITTFDADDAKEHARVLLGKLKVTEG